MTEEVYFYEPQFGHGLPHNPFYSIIGPRQIGWIASQSIDGIDNIAPYSFFGAFSVEPPIIGFTSEGWKDTVQNIKQTGEFCWNLVSRDLVNAMNATSSRVPHEVDEFKLANITKAECKLIKVKRVMSSPVSFECRLCDIKQLNSFNGTVLNRWLVLGEVVGVHIQKKFLSGGAYQTAKARPVMRAGGKSEYFEISNDYRFELQRPA